MRKFWFKAAMLLAGGALLQFPLTGGCLENIAQRILVDVAIA